MVACLLPQAGQLDAALAHLQQAVDLGYGHRAWIEHDGDLTPIRDDPRFAVILESIERHAPARR